MSEALQDRFAPHNRCFGCGPSNPDGLRIKSVPSEDGDAMVCDWTPQKRHESTDGIVNGGILGTLFDCHANWTSAWHLMRRLGDKKPPCTVTAEFTVKMKRPTPSTAPVRIVARVVEASDRKAVVEATMTSGGEVTATSHGVFVAVKEDHPAYSAW